MAKKYVAHRFLRIVCDSNLSELENGDLVGRVARAVVVLSCLFDDGQ
ncbi:MAG: hypothetical protein M2R46_05615 [Verrucomicrobia subdivision 3 bacterium]|nr:hypothetical protein [Limisphaerales bacterium]